MDRSFAPGGDAAEEGKALLCRSRSVMFALSGLEGFRSLIAERFGLGFDLSKLDGLSQLLVKRAETMGCSVESYLENLASQDCFSDEWRFLVSELTVSETCFFRHIEQLHACVEIVLPECLRSKTLQAPLRVLFAGCASGEEPYTIAMLIRTYFPDLGPGDLELQAVDVHLDMLRCAEQGRYSLESLRETPPEMKRRWFRAEGREFSLDGSIREMVTFHEANLVETGRDGFASPPRGGQRGDIANEVSRRSPLSRQTGRDGFASLPRGGQRGDIANEVSMRSPLSRQTGRDGFASPPRGGQRGDIANEVSMRSPLSRQDDSWLWKTASYDVIFCRNVIRYFTRRQAKDLISHAAQALVPGGYLFLGHGETLSDLSNDFHLCHSHDTYYYRRKDKLESPTDDVNSVRVPDAETMLSLDSMAGFMDSSDSWIDTILRASKRVEALSLPATAQALLESPAQTLKRAMELFQAKHYQDVLTILQDLPTHAPGSSEVLLLRAAVLIQSGILTEAETLCQTLLETREGEREDIASSASTRSSLSRQLSAEAHYLLALCREAAGDCQGAIAENKMAAYLDPGFALPSLHLGLLTRRVGDEECACAELKKALVLLHQENALRLLLYGGGFNRDTLLDLCQAELNACEGRLARIHACETDLARPARGDQRGDIEPEENRRSLLLDGEKFLNHRGSLRSQGHQEQSRIFKENNDK